MAEFLFSLTKNDILFKIQYIIFNNEADFNACRTELDKAEQQVVRLMKGPDGAPIENEFVSEE